MAVGQIQAAGAIGFGGKIASFAGAAGNAEATGMQAPVLRTTGGNRPGVASEAAPTAAAAGGHAFTLARAGRPAAAQPALTTPPRPLVSAASGHLPEAAPSNSNIAIVLFDLQSGIRRAQALIQSVSTEVSSASSRMTAAKAYSLEVQAQQEITKLQMEGVGQARQWYA